MDMINLLQILDLIIKSFAVIGIVFVIISYVKVQIIDCKIKRVSKTAGMTIGQMEARLKPLQDERNRIISKIPFLK